MTHRYYLPPPSTGSFGSHAKLEGPEAHHLLHVMHAQTGDEVTLFDGEGGEYPARVAYCGRQRVELELGSREEVDRELPVSIALGVALPKGERQKWLVEKLTELGVAKLAPLITERSVADVREKSLARLERSVIEASKQCGRNRLMEIAAPQPLGEFLSHAEGQRLLAHPTGPSVSEVTVGETMDVCIAIGPEGGFTENEIAEALRHGWQVVNLGPSILRVETAAIAMAAVVASRTRN